MLIGAISIGAGFFTGNAHHEATEHHESEGHHGQSEYNADGVAERHGTTGEHHGGRHTAEPHDDNYHKGASRAIPENNHFHQTKDNAIDAETVHHQQANKPWVNILISNFFFLAVALGALFFLAIQYAAQAGWSIVVTRIMEAMSQFLVVPVIIMLVLIIFGLNHSHHIWHWMAEGIMDPSSEHYDEIIAGKEGYLNGPFYIIRTVIYLIGWVGAALLLRKMSISLKTTDDPNRKWVKMRNLSAGFLVFFAVTSSTSAWDWIMSIDTHWFSTLFGWYVFAGMFVSALTVMTLIVLFLKGKGLLPEVNHSHIHDLGKFMFAFSVFWTYLWFSQFMLIWYSNIPEEVTYYMARFGEYKGIFFTMLVMNFVFPVLVLMSRDSKRNYGFLITAGIIMIIGHWLDVYIMITPGSVGGEWSIGLVELGTFLGFAGLFLFVVFRSLAKVSLMPEGHPMLQESKYHHI